MHTVVSPEEDDETVRRYYATFKTLAALAKLRVPSQRAPVHLLRPATEKPIVTKTIPESTEKDNGTARQVEYHYNIQIHLPATTDITVYNSIFRSLKENLGL